MAEQSGSDAPSVYEYMHGVETLRQLPNVSLNNESAVAIRIPGETAGEPPATEVTYEELQLLVERTASLLREKTGLGTTVGDICSIVMPNCVEFVLAFLSVTWTRSVSAPLNPNYTESEYEFYLQDNKSKLVLIPASGDGTATVAVEAAAQKLGISVYQVGWTSEGKTAVTLEHKSGPVRVAVVDDGDDGKCKGNGAVGNDGDEGPTETKKSKLAFEPEPDDVCLFLHTSGTTAKPKGVPLTHANLVASMNNIARTYKLEPADAVLLVMPLFHVHGLMSALNSTLATGGTVVLPPQTQFSATKFWHNAVVSSVCRVSVCGRMIRQFPRRSN